MGEHEQALRGTRFAQARVRQRPAASHLTRTAIRTANEHSPRDHGPYDKGDALGFDEASPSVVALVFMDLEDQLARSGFERPRGRCAAAGTVDQIGESAGRQSDLARNSHGPRRFADGSFVAVPGVVRQLQHLFHAVRKTPDRALQVPGVSDFVWCAHGASCCVRAAMACPLRTRGITWMYGAAAPWAHDMMYLGASLSVRRTRRESCR